MITDQYRGKQVLVTGGAGFIGHYLVAALLQAGAQVSVLDDFSTGRMGSLPHGIRLIEGDVREPGVCATALEPGVTHVFHLAGRASVRTSHEDPYQDADINLMGTLALLRAMVGRKVKRLVFASSKDVYADRDQPKPIDESWAAEPLSPHGVTKLACERMLKITAPDLDLSWCALRLFNVYGRGQVLGPDTGVVSIFINRMIQGKALTIYGDGEQRRDFVHVRDAVQAFLRVGLSKAQGVFNIGAGQAASINQVAAIIGGALGVRPRINREARHPGELHLSVADISAARRVFDYAPRHDLLEALPELAREMAEE